MHPDNVTAAHISAFPAPDRPKRILLLGGTSDASQLAKRLAGRTGLTVISSLAGRVSQPNLPAGIVRIGGFGGVDGLTRYLVEERIDLVIDATHPFAAKISGNAELASGAANIPLLAFERPPWKQQPHDRWISVPDVQSAARLTNRKHNRVFLSIGRLELSAFSACEDAWFLVRAIDRPGDALPANSKLMLQRGPFNLHDERQLLQNESINMVVTKNSGGPATYAKVEAARELQIPVVMIDRPRKHNLPTAERLDDILLRLAELL
jgi:precorrin-6A/cobalt-precorrin-6A reductase